MKTLRLIAGLISLLAASAAYAGNHDAILGNWTTANAKSTVELYTCGAKVCGKIIALKEPTYPADDKQGMAGKIKIDRENPDPKLRNEPIIGLVILRDLEHTDEGRWKNGTIYDPENGKTYKSRLTLVNPKQLDVRGFIGFALIGRTTEWTR
jgi:uncharacterized protein (DUF2147 family)